MFHTALCQDVLWWLLAGQRVRGDFLGAFFWLESNSVLLSASWWPTPSTEYWSPLVRKWGQKSWGMEVRNSWCGGPSRHRHLQTCNTYIQIRYRPKHSLQCLVCIAHKYSWFLLFSSVSLGWLLGKHSYCRTRTGPTSPWNNGLDPPMRISCEEFLLDHQGKAKIQIFAQIWKETPSCCTHVQVETLLQKRRPGGPCPFSPASMSFAGDPWLGS